MRIQPVHVPLPHPSAEVDLTDEHRAYMRSRLYGHLSGSKANNRKLFSGMQDFMARRSLNVDPQKCLLIYSACPTEEKLSRIVGEQPLSEIMSQRPSIRTLLTP
jgi:hypothetical protein